jgi:hypothetical protein
MVSDFEVFRPGDQGLAQLLVRVLGERGYAASYQLGYPYNKVFAKVNTKEEANKISTIISDTLKNYGVSAAEIAPAKLQELTSTLTELIPHVFEKPEAKIPSENIAPQNTAQYSVENLLPLQAPKVEEPAKISLEELKALIVERLEFLNTQMSKHHKDRANELRAVEIDTLNWVLRNMQ